MASRAETGPEAAGTNQEKFLYHIAWLAGTVALLAVGVEAAHDILTQQG